MNNKPVIDDKDVIEKKLEKIKYEIKSNPVDERVRQIKHKISNEAFGILFLCLMIITFTKSVLLNIPVKLWWEEAAMFFGISIYVVLRMISSGIYNNGTIRKTSEGRAFSAVVATIVFACVMAFIEFKKGTMDVPSIAVSTLFFAAFYYLTYKLADRASQKRAEKELKDDEKDDDAD